MAAEGNHLDVPKYLHENGCPWGEMTFEYAQEFGDFALLRWAIDNDCP